MPALRARASSCFFRGRALPWLAAAATLVLIGWARWTDSDARPALNEYWQVAAALLDGRGFADPFGIESGPTAWVAPLPVWLYAALVGLTRDLSAAFALAGGVKALGYAGAAWLWTRWVWRRAGRGAPLVFVFAWLCLLWAGQGRHLTGELHDPWLVGVVLAATLCAWGGLGRDRWSRRMATLAFAAGPLVGPAVWLVQVTLVGARLGVCGRAGARAFWLVGCRPLVPLLAAMALTGGAWTLRNRVVFDAWVPIKSNAGFEAWQAQCATPDGVPGYATFLRHPFIDGAERARFAAEGERAYVARHAAAFRESARAEPGDFARRILNRAVNALVSLELPRAVSRKDQIGVSADAWAKTEREAKSGNIPESGRLAVGFALAGAPALAAALLGWHAWRRRGLRAPELALVVGYFAYLAPYVAISHYARYQLPLAGWQAALLALAAGALVFPRRSGRAGA